MFPYLPDQSGYHKRLNDADLSLRKAILILASSCVPSWFDDMWSNNKLRVTGQDVTTMAC
jgi:hypothetical protein